MGSLSLLGSQTGLIRLGPNILTRFEIIIINWDKLVLMSETLMVVYSLSCEQRLCLHTQLPDL